MSGRPRVVVRIVRYFLHSKLTALLVLAVSLVGLFAVLLTPREENPQITAPAAVITVSDAGAGRDQVEQLVTKPLERVLQETPGIDHIYAVSTEDLSTVTVQFKVGENRTRAYVDLYSQLTAHQDALPPGAGPPQVTPLDVDDVPIVVLTLWGPRYDDAQLRRFAYRVVDAVQPVQHVSVVSVYGGREQAVDVALDPGRMSGYALSPQDVERALGVTNIEQGAGYVSAGGRRLLLHAGTPFSSAEQVAGQVVAVRDGQPVLLSDVARVAMGSTPLESFAAFGRWDVGPAVASVSVSVAKTRGSNAVTTARDVIAAARAVALPPGISLTVTRDDGAKANAAVSELIGRLIEAIAIVTGLLLVTLGWREAGVVALAIPLTLFITLGIGMLVHQTINRITLFALILALGLLVDDAIVIVENIHRHLRRQVHDRTQAIAEAVGEIASPTILATVTVILAFVPMAFVTGMMGPYMRPIPFNVPVAMLASMVVAIVVTPWAASRLVGARAGGTPHRPLRWEPLYRRVLGALLDRPRLRVRVLGAVALAVAAVMLLPLLTLVKFRMLPRQNENTMLVTLDEPAGTDLETTGRVARALAAAILANPNVADVETFVGRHSVPDFNGLLQGVIFRDAPWYADLRVNLRPKEQRRVSSAEIARDLRTPLQAIGAREAGIVKIVQEPPGPPVRATVMAKVYGSDPSIRRAIADEVASLLRVQPGVVDVDSTIKAEPARVQITVDARKAALAGLSPAAVADDLALAYAGAGVTALHAPQAPEPIPVFVRLAAENRADLTGLDAIAIPGPRGSVPLSSVSQVSQASETRPALREDGRSVDYVTGEMAGRSSTYAVIDMMLAMTRHPLPPGYTVAWDGEWKLTLDVFRDLGRAMGVAVILIYLVLVAWYRSFTVPFVVMAAIPLGLIGIMPGFAVMGARGVYFSATAMIGVIALSGIVVRNSIVLVEFIEDELRRGIPLREAVLRAGLVRARPILLTAGSGVFSSAVIASDPVWSGLAWALIFGMAASALLSILVVPVLYTMVARDDVLVERYGRPPLPAEPTGDPGSDA